MRKSALLISAAVMAVCLPTLASAAPPKSAPPADPNANSKKFVGDWVGQIFVPAQSMAPKPAEPAKAAKKAGKKKSAKAKSDKKKG
jgi:hypothetical protein